MFKSTLYTQQNKLLLLLTLHSNILSEYNNNSTYIITNGKFFEVNYLFIKPVFLNLNIKRPDI